MKVWQLQKFGLDDPVLSDIPQPEPGPGEVLIRVFSVAPRKIRLVVTTEYREVSSALSRCGNSSRIPSYFETARAALSIRSETSCGCET
jgi:hypothetical protein